MNLEIWISIDLLKYAVSSTGRVKSLARPGSGAPKVDIIMSPLVKGNKYLSVMLSGKRHYVHRLVAQAFIGNPSNKPCVNHIDGDKDNNHVDNLEWVTYSENMHHAVKNGLTNHPKGEAKHGSKLKENDIKDIRKRANLGETATSLSKFFKVSSSHIRKIIRREKWAHVT